MSKISWLENGLTILVVKRNEYNNNLLANNKWGIYLNGGIHEKLESLKELSLLNQSKNLDEIPLQTTTKLDKLKNINLELNKVELRTI